MSGPHDLHAPPTSCSRRGASSARCPWRAASTSSGLASAAAQAPDYKALVCVFLFGGNDSNSMVIPFTRLRPVQPRPPRLASGVNVAAGVAACTITPDEHAAASLRPDPAFTTTNGNPTLQALFDAGKLAVVANAGTLIEPMTRAEYRVAHGAEAAEQLFSHSDQQQQCMTSISQASTLTGINGWGGRVGDKVAEHEPAERDADVDVVLRHADLRQRRAGAHAVAADGGQLRLHRRQHHGAARQRAVRARGGARRRCSPPRRERDGRRGAGERCVAQNASTKINPILNGTGGAAITGPFTGAQQRASRTSCAPWPRSSRHARRSATTAQIFFVSIGGFDTHSGQGIDQRRRRAAGLYQQIGQAMAAFYQLHRSDGRRRAT